MTTNLSEFRRRARTRRCALRGMYADFLGFYRFDRNSGAAQLMSLDPSHLLRSRYLFGSHETSNGVSVSDRLWIALRGGQIEPKVRPHQIFRYALSGQVHRSKVAF